MNEFSSILLTEVSLRTTQPLQLGCRYYEQDEIVLYMDNVTLGSINETILRPMSRGGIYNLQLMHWREIDQIDFFLQRGILTPEDWMLLEHAGLIENTQINANRRQNFVFNGSLIVLEDKPLGRVFAYVNGKKLPFNQDPTNPEQLTFPTAKNGDKIIVDYVAKYDSTFHLKANSNLINGTFRLDAKTIIRYEPSNEQVTGVFYMPCVKIDGQISFGMGMDGNPIVGLYDLKALRTRNEPIYSFSILDKKL